MQTWRNTGEIRNTWYNSISQIINFLSVKNVRIAVGFYIMKPFEPASSQSWCLDIFRALNWELIVPQEN